MNVFPRPIAVPGTDALPLYVQAHRAKVAKSGDTLIVTVEDKKVAAARLTETSQVVLMGNVSVTTPCLHELMWRGIPVTWHSFGGWFLGHTTGNGHKNVELRTAQYRASFDEAICLRFAKGLVSAKIQNCRTLLRRNWKPADSSQPVLVDLKSDSSHAGRATSLAELLGIEGTGAARYFRAFGSMLNKGASDEEHSHPRRSARVRTGAPDSRALCRHLCALAPFRRRISSVSGRPLSFRHRQRPDPPQHVAEQPPGQMPLRQQEPVVPRVLHQPPPGLHQPAAGDS